jgi:MFS family permease
MSETAASVPSPATAPGFRRGVLLPCLLLLGAMFNLTLPVAGLKELILDELGGTVTDAALFLTVEMAAYLLFAPLWGVLSDRVARRRPFVVVGFAGSAAAYFAYLGVQSVDALLALRFVQGAFSVMGWSTAMALVADHAEEPRRGRTMGLLGASLILGVGLGAPVGGYVTRHLGARAPLEWAGWLFLALAVASLALPESRGGGRHAPRLAEILDALRRRPRLLLPWTFHLVDRLTVGCFIVVFPLYLASLGAGDAAHRGRYLGLFLLPFALLQAWTGRLSERTGAAPPLVWGTLGYGLVLTFVGLADLLLLWPAMVALGVLAAFMFPPTLTLTAQLADPRARASAMGGFNFAGSLGFALGPLLGAWAQGRGGFTAAFAVAGALEIALALGGAILLRRWAAGTRNGVR